MHESIRSPRDDGSAPRVPLPKDDPSVRAAYVAFMNHAAGSTGRPACQTCRADGVDCPTARALRKTWREARTAYFRAQPARRVTP